MYGVAEVNRRAFLSVEMRDLRWPEIRVETGEHRRWSNTKPVIAELCDDDGSRTMINCRRYLKYSYLPLQSITSGCRWAGYVTVPGRGSEW